MSRNRGEIEPKIGGVVRIGRMTFDADAGQLRDAEGKHVPLRSQSADVLAYLARHPDRVVPKDELTSAVWPETFVTDDSLVQCIGDIRRALGVEGRDHVLTHPRRGYRLVPTPAPGSADTRPAHRRAAIAATLLMVLAVAAGAYGWRSRQRASDADDVPMIAVLPFQDLSAGADKGYLSDAIAEGVITELARSKTYAVIASNSSFKYRGKPTDVRDIGRDLGVDYVLEGSQQKVGDRLQVNAQLIDARSGRHLWANLYDREIGDLFAVQGEIVRTLADRVGVRIEKPLPETDRARVSALHYYMEGEARARADFSAASMAAVRAFGERAIEADPDSPFGHLSLAWANLFDAIFGWNGADREAALALAERHADRAIALDPNNAETHLVRGRLYDERGEHELAIQRYDRAIELNPSDSSILETSSEPLLYVGRADEAIARIRQAMGVDPFYPDHFHWQMSWALWEKGDCEGAVSEMRKMAVIPDAAQKMFAAALSCAGHLDEARAALASFLKTSNLTTLHGERASLAPMWSAPGSLDRWIVDLRRAGLAE